MKRRGENRVFLFTQQILYAITDTVSGRLQSETKEVSVMYQVKYVFGHYNVYAPSGRFLFSADTESEAWDELEQMDQ